MNFIDNKSMIYVVCPYYNKTGGTELAHQLVYTICKLGGKAEITYYGDKDARKEINPAFLQYTKKYVDISQIEDSKHNIIVLPEIRPDLADGMKNIQKCVWWMSVDNFLKRDGVQGFVNYYGVLRTIRHIFLGHVQFKRYKFLPDVTHLYQSEYAHQFLTQNGVTKCHRLSDYINKIYLEDDQTFDLENRKNQVLYNPKKGFAFTKKIMQATPDLTWIPIQNMTTEEVHRLLKESKVYVDFGNHPGKDRFPREAAISMCCIITGKRGSAKYYQDIPISDAYKFEDKDENVAAIAGQIRKCLNEYKKMACDFQVYRDFIYSEPMLFENDVKELFITKK
ncbi:MAG: hypothetical protein HFG62_00010 [Lachnospiraceae bacterium]|nr:hypothetical protein [Lachnospiraceae bacterium]